MMLEQELEKYLSGQTLCNCDSVSYRNIKNLILGFAEPIEKRIAELEESNKEWQRTCEAKSDTNSQLVEQLADKVEKIATLERNVAYYAERAKHAELDGRDYVLKNKDLGKRCLQLQKDKGNMTDRVRELEQQIEKMKCCYNCKSTVESTSATDYNFSHFQREELSDTSQTQIFK